MTAEPDPVVEVPAALLPLLVQDLAAIRLRIGNVERASGLTERDRAHLAAARRRVELASGRLRATR